VKKLGQRLPALFIGAQKTAKLACNWCKNGREKQYMAFAEGVEET
jgi:hypothetical protein